MFSLLICSAGTFLLYRLHKLVWSPGIKSPNNSSQPDFLIGGAEQGRLFIWNPKNIFSKEEPLVYLLDKHVGAVSALDVNPFQVYYCSQLIKIFGI